MADPLGAPRRDVRARREGPRVTVEPLESGWAQAEWLQSRLAGWREGNPQPHWTATYFKPRIDDAVISVSTPIRDAAGRVLGMAASDWVADDIIGLVSDVQVTPSTFAFLVDRENRNLSSLARAEDMQRAQRLIEEVSALELHHQAGELAAMEGMARRDLTLAGQPWSLYRDATRAGMVFGIAVPQAEIDAVLAPMRGVNLQLLIGIGLVLLLLAGVVLFLVAGLLRQLRTLYTDPLTRLPNRARLLADLEAGRAGSLMLVNVDGFKQFNDLFGHHCGDRVIQRVAERLEELLKESGWRDCRLYRMPGDEQAVWFPGAVADDTLHATVDSLYHSLNGLRLDWRGQELPLQMTLGVASSWQLVNGGDGDEALLSSANIALKQARVAQRPYAFYDPATRVRRDYERNLAWANRLAEALDDGRVVAYFQPILEVASGRVGKFECLVRMLDEEGSPVSPGVFLEVARRSRLYRRLTLTMIDRCLAALAESPHEFSLNLSGEDIVDAEISEALLARVAESGVGERLIFEILESEGIDNYAAVSAFIARAKALGVRIAIDDFGQRLLELRAPAASRRGPAQDRWQPGTSARLRRRCRDAGSRHRGICPRDGHRHGGGVRAQCRGAGEGTGPGRGLRPGGLHRHARAAPRVRGRRRRDPCKSRGLAFTGDAAPRQKPYHGRPLPCYRAPADKERHQCWIDCPS